MDWPRLGTRSGAILSPVSEGLCSLSDAFWHREDLMGAVGTSVVNRRWTTKAPGTQFTREQSSRHEKEVRKGVTEDQCALGHNICDTFKAL